MKNSDDAKREIDLRIINNINYLMEKSETTTKKYSQLGFIRFCKDNYGISFDKSNLSNILNPKIKRYPNLALVYYMSKYLNVDMEFLMCQDFSPSTRIIQLMETVNDRKENNLIFDISHPYFEPYTGDYEFYFCPTISDEAKKEQFLHGTMHIRTDWNNLCCRVEMELDTNTLIKGTNKPYYKVYKGIMFISDLLDVCYCIVENAKLGECNCIAFRHVRKPNNMDYLGGMAAVLTVSAGGDNVPTMHRMLISRGHVSNKKLESIKGNLKLNQSKILISKAELEKVLKQLNLTEEAISRIINNTKEETYYQLKESVLRDMDSEMLHNINKSKLIAQIRDASTAIYYNKISKKLDEHILQLLSN